MFGDPQVFVTAKQMLGLPGVSTCPPAPVTYIHLMLDNHQIIFANGAATESLHAAEESLKALCPQARDELFICMPGLRAGLGEHGPTARRCLKTWEAQALLSRSTPITSTTRSSPHKVGLQAPPFPHLALIWQSSRRAQYRRRPPLPGPIMHRSAERLKKWP